MAVEYKNDVECEKLDAFWWALCAMWARKQRGVEMKSKHKGKGTNMAMSVDRNMMAK